MIKRIYLTVIMNLEANDDENDNDYSDYSDFI